MDQEVVAARAPGSDALEAAQTADMQPEQACTSVDAAGVEATDAAAANEEGSGNLFVGDLSRGITEEDLVHAFSRFGQVVDASIKRDRFSQRNLGYGFVQMATKSQASEALAQMHGAELAGRQIRINWAQRTARLFAGGLPSSITVPQLIELFKVYGPLGEEDIVLKDAKNTSGKFAFIKYLHRQHAEDARRELQNGCEEYPSMRVDWHHSNSSGQYNHYTRQRDMLPTSVLLSDYSVYIHFEVEEPGVDVTEESLRATFGHFGPIVSTAVKAKHVSEETGKLRGYGFVHFDGTGPGRQAATTVVRTVAGVSLNGVRYQADFSNSTKRQAAGALTAQHIAMHPAAPTPAGLPMDYMFRTFDATTGMVFPSYQMYPRVSPSPTSSSLDGDVPGHVSPSPTHGGFPLMAYNFPYMTEQAHAAQHPMYMQPAHLPEAFGGRFRNRMPRDPYRQSDDNASLGRPAY